MNRVIMRNRILLFLAGAIGTVVMFFICALVFQYFVDGIVDYSEAVRFALTYGLPIFIVREIFEYFRKKYQ